jgi:hypothetical protein
MVFASAPWDVLRPGIELATLFNPLILFVSLIISLVLVIISFLAWNKSKSKRLLIVFGAFSLFFIKSILMVLDFYFSPGIFMNFAVQGFFDLLIIGILFIALFKK